VQLELLDPLEEQVQLAQQVQQVSREGQEDTEIQLLLVKQDIQVQLAGRVNEVQLVLLV
jgi:hypothetical protein